MPDPATGSDLLKRIGSYWAHVFPDDTLRVLLDDQVEAFNQSRQNLAEVQLLAGRHTAPPFHLERWYPLRLRASQQLDTDCDQSVWGAGYVFDGTLQFGGTAPMPAVFPLDARIRGIGRIQNAIVNPTLTWETGSDYALGCGNNQSVIAFGSHPFETAQIVPQFLFDSQGIVEDREVLLWAADVEFDEEWLWKHWGYVLNVRGTSSEAYRAVLNGLFDARQVGCSEYLLRRLISSMTGIPIVLEDEETVVSVTTAAVQTDMHSYELASGAVAVVHAGQVVRRGDPLSDGLEFRDLSGAAPDYSMLEALTLDADFLGPGYLGSLSFRNAEVALTSSLDAGGNTRVEFEVYGFPGDVEQFWDAVHARGLASGSQLADALDQRPATAASRAYQPHARPENLPATINPAAFLIENLLSNHLLLVRIALSQVTTGADFLRYLNELRGVVPADLAYLLRVDLPGMLEYAKTAWSDALTGVEAPDNSRLTLPSSGFRELSNVRLVAGLVV